MEEQILKSSSFSGNITHLEPKCPTFKSGIPQPISCSDLRELSSPLSLHFLSCCCCSVVELCPTLCDPMNCSTPGFPVLQYLPEFAQTHVHWIIDAIQPSHLLLPPSPFAPNLSQHQGLFQWVGSSHQVTKVLELQLQHQSFHWTLRVDFL